MTPDPAVRDDAAYSALFAAHHDSVLRLAYVLTSDLDAAEEAVADAFAAMYPRWRAGRVDDEVAYLRSAVVNAVRSRWRRRATRNRHAERHGPPRAVPTRAELHVRAHERAQCAGDRVGAALGQRVVDRVVAAAVGVALEPLVARSTS